MASDEFLLRSEYHAYRRDIEQRLKQLAAEISDLKAVVEKQEKYWDELEKRIRNIELVQAEIKVQFRVWMIIAIVAIPLIERVLERFVK